MLLCTHNTFETVQHTIQIFESTEAAARDELCFTLLRLAHPPDLENISISMRGEI